MSDFIPLILGAVKASLDSSSRLSIPRDMRGPMLEAYPESKSSLYVTLSEDGTHIVAYPPSVFSELLGLHREKARSGDRDERAKAVGQIQRMSYAASPCPMDAQGRVRLGKELCKRVDLPKEVMVCGEIDHLVVLTLEEFERRMRADGQ